MIDIPEIIFDLIKVAKNICITAHRNPDSDAYGSVLALNRIISELYPDKNHYFNSFITR